MLGLLILFCEATMGGRKEILPTIEVMGAAVVVAWIGWFKRTFWIELMGPLSGLVCKICVVTGSLLALSSCIMSVGALSNACLAAEV